MNFRQHFETWHKKTYGYVGQGRGTLLSFTYQTTACQQRWEGWQACADWHTSREFQAQQQVQPNVVAPYVSQESFDRAFPEAPRCSVCSERQVKTPSGLVCTNGHGGAESL